MIPSERGERFIESQIFATFYDEVRYSVLLGEDTYPDPSSSKLFGK